MPGKEYHAIEYITVNGSPYQIFYALESNGKTRPHTCPNCKTPGTVIEQNYDFVEIRHARHQQRQVKRGGTLWQEIEKIFRSSPRRIDDCFTCDFCFDQDMIIEEAGSIANDAIDLSVPMEEIDPSEM